MKHPSFLRGALLGLGISIASMLLFSLLSLLFSNDLAIRCLIAGAGLIYIVQLIALSGERVGAVTTMTVWTVASAALLWVGPPLIFYLLAHIVFIWLIRSLYFYSSILPSLADLGLSLLSFSAAVWAAQHTGNVFLSFWCFFLVQALWSAIPLYSKDRRMTQPVNDDRFQEAYRSAEAALGRLLSIH